MRRKSRLAWIFSALALTALPASAQTALKVGCVLATDCASISVAQKEGIFQKHGLDVTVEFIAFNALVPAALMSNSLQVGALFTTVFLQAADGGLDLTAISGGTVFTGKDSDGYAVVVRKGSNLHKPADFVGKKVATPSTNGVGTVLFMDWLIKNSVDPASVSLVEVPYASIGDSLSSGSVEAGLLSEPMISRVIGTGAGELGAYTLETVPPGTPALTYTTTRDWAEANPETVAKFRAAIAEAANIVETDPDRARAAHSATSGTPLEVLKRVTLAKTQLNLKPSDFDWWLETMKLQNLLQSEVDTSRLIAP